jgi:hypothetical protein
MLDKSALSSSIKQAFLDQRSKESDPETAAEDLAGKIATAVEAYVKSLTVVYTAGLVAPSGGGPVTGTLTHTIT